MKNIVWLLLLIVPVYQVIGQIPEADQIMNKSREQTMVGSMQATINLSITEKNGAKRTRTIVLTTKSFSGGLEKRFIKFLEPADIRGTAMLIIDNKDVSDEIWIYLPALKKTRRISSSENGKSFMSSEFSNSDMGSPRLADFKSRHLEDSGTNNTWIIESIPIDDEKADEYGYTKKISFINKDKLLIQKMEFYNFDNELFKTIEMIDFHTTPEGKFMVSDMIAINIVTNRRSEIHFNNIVDQVKVEDSYFSIQNLER